MRTTTKEIFRRRSPFVAMFLAALACASMVKPLELPEKPNGAIATPPAAVPLEDLLQQSKPAQNNAEEPRKGGQATSDEMPNLPALNTGVFDGTLNEQTGLLNGTVSNVVFQHAQRTGWTLSDNPNAAPGTVDPASQEFQVAVNDTLQGNGLDPANHGTDVPANTPVGIFPKGA